MMTPKEQQASNLVGFLFILSLLGVMVWFMSEAIVTVG